jgi:tRNA modification GTPase
MNAQDTIAAISSAVGPSARMIVRLSGDQAGRIGGELADIWEARPGRAVSAMIWPGVRGWVYWFAGPRSYSGDDLVEFHIPGSPVLARMLLDEIVRRGARPAEPGEFTARAYFNGRMDLTQAEGVAATIAAHSERELRAARQLMGGELAKRLTPVMESLAQTLALVEAGIDFSDEGVSFMSSEEVSGRCEEAGRRLRAILDESARFERLSHEPRIVLVGRPNAGKSTLLNALAGRERAVVSNIAGTTRDAIWAEVRLARGMVRVVDVAGFSTDLAHDEIERQMHEQAMREVATAELVVMVQDVSHDQLQNSLARGIDLRVLSKSDLFKDEVRADKNVYPTVIVSAKTGEGIEELKLRLDELAFGPKGGGGTVALNARHVRALGEAIEALERARTGVEAGAEVVAMELRETLEVLGSVLGRISPDDLLGRIFSQFCIGK